MKSLRLLTLAATFVAALFTHGNAFAEAIHGGSIRVNVDQPATEIKIRYMTEQGTVEKSIAPDEVLHLSRFEIVDQNQQFPLLNPTQNQFDLYKDDTTGFVLTGGSDDLVRLSFEKAGTQEVIKLDMQWTPKLEILTSNSDKVEVLDESDSVLHAIDENALFLTSDNGMAIRFVVPAAPDQGDQGNQGGNNPGDQPAPQGNGDDVQANSSGGCTLSMGAVANSGSGLYLLLPMAFAAARRARRK